MSRRLTVSRLKHVYAFELGNYFKSKSYMISTILICVLAAVAMSLPGILASLSGDDSGDEGSGSDSVIAESIAICDPEGILSDDQILAYGKAEIRRMDSEEEVRESVKSEETAVGFVLRSSSEFDYYVFNRSAFDETQEVFRSLMSAAAQAKYCEENGVDYADNRTATNTIIGCTN